MPQQTPYAGLPYPESSDPATVRQYFQDLAQATDPFMGPSIMVYNQAPSNGFVNYTDVLWGDPAWLVDGEIIVPETGLYDIFVTAQCGPTTSLEWIQFYISGSLKRPGFTLPTSTSTTRIGDIQKTEQMEQGDNLAVFKSGDSSFFGTSLMIRRVAP